MHRVGWMIKSNWVMKLYERLNVVLVLGDYVILVSKLYFGEES